MGVTISLALAVTIATSLLAIAGCGQKKNDHQVKMPPSRYADKGPRPNMPVYLKERFTSGRT